MRSLQDNLGEIDLGDISRKYELPPEAAKEIVERSVSDTLSVLLRSDVECLLTEHGTEIFIFRESGVEQLPVEMLKKSILREVKYGIVSALYREQALRSYEELRFMTGGIVGGYVTKIFEDCIYVELDTRVIKPIAGICKKQHQPRKERGRYRLGDFYSFYISCVTPHVNRSIPEVKIFLSRASKSLAEGLLRKELDDIPLDVKVICTERMAGVYSLIMAQERIPRECIKAVSDELKERIIVHVVQKK